MIAFVILAVLVTVGSIMEAGFQGIVLAANPRRPSYWWVQLAVGLFAGAVQAVVLVLWLTGVRP